MSLVNAIVERVKASHPYEVPGISTRPIVSGNPDYLAWIAAATRLDPTADEDRLPTDLQLRTISRVPVGVHPGDHGSPRASGLDQAKGNEHDAADPSDQAGIALEECQDVHRALE
jgi:hypothetical protein